MLHSIRSILTGQRGTYLLLTVTLVLVCATGVRAQTPARRGRTTPATQRTPEQIKAAAEAAKATADSIKAIAQERLDSLRAVKNASRRPSVRWTDRYATRFSDRNPRSPYLLRDPRSLNTDFRMLPDRTVTVTERITPRPGVATPSVVNPSVITAPGASTLGTSAPAVAGPVSQTGAPRSNGLIYRPGENVPYSEYNRLQNERIEDRLFRENSARRDGQSAVSGRGLIPKLEVPPVFDRIFGGNNIDFKPNGFVTLDLGYLHQFIDNPAVPVRLRRQGNLIFNEQISINFNGQIGERLGVLANFDTKASFNFENALKVNYRPQGLIPGLGANGLPNLPQVPGLPNLPAFGSRLSNPQLPFTPQNESILQNVEVGNLTWNLNSQLIPGVQNLFGLKLQTRFGKLNATTVLSQQRSKKQEIVLRGGTLNRPFEIRADQYDENRHFFLSQFFRSNYERSLKSLPNITSGVTVTRLEVYVTNRTNTTDQLRNVVGFSDLAEPAPFNRGNPNIQTAVAPGSPADNAANTLFARLKASAPLRNADQTPDVLTGTFGLQRGTDYDMLRGAKRLTDREYRFEPQLGYISLITPLRNDEVLAVSYEYTYQGRRYQVGELTEDYQSQGEDKVLYLKLLKSTTIRNNLQNPMWNLMMKNVYSLNTTALSRQGFQMRIVYKDDVSGIDNPNLQDSKLANIPLVQVFEVDKLNAQLDPQPDGNFDYIEGITVDSRNGKIIFPVLEPFGPFLRNKLQDPIFESKYVFEELYRTTLADAQQIAVKNKFFIRGSFQSGQGQGIDLPYGVKEQSVQVSAGGVPLVAGQDYVVEGQRVRILNESISNSGREIRISFETPDLFQNQIRTLVGARLDYRLTPEINVGMTAMNMRETPSGFLTRVAIGNEPVNNTMLGFDINLRKDSPGLTRFLDRLPFIQTKELSAVQFTGEVAEFIPGVSPRANNNAFIDDFEATRTIFDLTRQPTRWRIGSTPQEFPQGSAGNVLEYGYRRARTSVYSVDQTLYLPDATGGVGSNLTQNDLSNVYERYFLPNVLFPGRSPRQIQQPENILDVAYFPSERGIYNYNPNLNNDGTLPNPRQNFGAVTRAVSSDNDFDNANIENIVFWMMDPFVQGENGKVRGNPDNSQNFPNSTGGILHFNLGDVSEDVIKDGRFNFENGIPIDTTNSRLGGRLADTPWGKAPTQQFVTNAFTNQEGARQKQDIGLDGLNNNEEQAKFKPYLDAVRARVTNQEALRQIESDPSNDDFRYYLGAQADSARYVVARYKSFMGMEGNSPETANDLNNFTSPASSILPDIEDLNSDNTINEQEAYYDYSIDLRPGRLAVGNGYIIDKVNAEGVDWYLFRIPVRNFTNKVGNINGFKSIRFFRMYLTDFAQPVVLRFAQLQMEANQYRRYAGDLTQRGLQDVPEPYDAQFKVSAVNVEENNQVSAEKYVYDVPPGFIRDVDYTQPNNNVQLNEQSMALSVTNLRDGDSRGAFRNTNFDFVNRDRLNMFIHMHNPQDEDGQVGAFLRIGTDYTENYYEIEIPGLKSTRRGPVTVDEIWPSQNELDLAFSELTDLKAARNKQLSRRTGLPFTQPSANQRYNLTIVGNPDLSSVQSIMIGVRNPKSSDEQSKTFTIWVDELRATGINQQSGRAAIGALNLRLADLATITASGRYSSFGFGGVQTKPTERTREEATEFGLTAALSLDKFLPEKWGLKIPFYANYDSRLATPQFDPLDPDMPLEKSIASLPEGNPISPSEYRRLVQDMTTRRGINFSNVRKIRVDPNGKAHFWDIENFGFNYAFNDIRRSNILTGEYIQEQYRGGITYNFTSQPKPFEPFRNVPGLERKYLYWLKDFNLTLLPTIVSIRADIDRSYIKTQLRNADLSTNGISPQFEKYFFFNRYYDLTWNLTKNLVVSYRAAANAIIDEPYGEINTPYQRDSIWRSLQNLGRMKNYQQEIKTTYRIPFDKFPIVNWVQGDLTYNIGYQFTANSFGIKDSLFVPFGNTIRNNREVGIVGRVDLVLLYNKIRTLRWANTPSPPRLNFARNPGSIQEINPGGNQLLKSFVRALMTVRGINVSYNVQENTILPGFLPTPGLFGLDNFGAPGLPFVLGDQNGDIARRAARAGWLSPSTVQNAPFTQAVTKRFLASTTLEPFRDFRINVTANYNRSDNYQEFYRPAISGAGFSSQAPIRNGSYSMSYFSFGTTFERLRVDNTSPIFDKFEAYRDILQQRLNADNPVARDNPNGYNKNSQDVLIPAFFAAYSGSNPWSVKYSPFYNLPFPNWDLNYSGLNKVKPFSKVFTSFNLVHRYTSTYSVGNFVSSLSYEAQFVNLAVNDYNIARQLNENGQFIPIFVMSTMSMSERFGPFIGIRFQTKNRLSGSLEYNRSRDAALNLTNAQVAEVNTKDVTASLGFTKQNVRLPFRVNGAIKRLKNDLTFNCALTLRDTRTIQRKLEAEQIITAGNVNFQVRPQLSYVVNRRLNVNFYFDRTFNDPLVSNSFIRATTSGGVQVRFNLAE
ncbi:T9SS outer membrane translocon Sov/SprA [Fibrivirga algicola]|uniref:Cell surface protein SprA n=1 Tax=Fibrivirga algicola TaxID=2950420 RepID=A0ABX0QKT4_9BACT|nr:cell surface protein SprA [Fibrivirga algicola]NID13044.1 cell surface protein SprA [Fibrivirga algicola]